MVLLGALGLVPACGSPSNRLFGSVSEIYDLGFDKVQVSTIGSFVVVEYLRTSGGVTVAKPAKLSVDTTGLTVSAGQSIDLTEAVASGTRGTLQRIEQTPTDLPIGNGFVVFDQVPAADSKLGGRFRTTLTDPAGRTCNGDFSAKVIQL
jgi:hypothetical protein